MHAPQLEGVVFPGRRRARDAAEARAWGDGYTMQDFLEANVRTKPGRKGTSGGREPPEVFVCGGWRAGPAADAATSVAFAGVPGFRTVPAGVCERVVVARAFYKASLGRFVPRRAYNTCALPPGPHRDGWAPEGHPGPANLWA
jgi:hypothetical protein